MDSPEQPFSDAKEMAIPASSSTMAPPAIASSAPNPRLIYSSSSSNEGEADEFDGSGSSQISGRSSPFSQSSSGSSLSPTAVYATMLSTNNIVSNSVSSTTRLPNQPTLLQHKSLSFLIMDAPSQSNLRLYLQEMQKANVKHVVRVCEPTYSKEIVEAAGIEVHDWVFPDGESPPAEVIERWLKLIDAMAEANERVEEAANYAVAVHCVAGLGRAPVLVAIALIEYGMSALDAVAFVRQRRRGAINNKQLKFLEKYQSRRERRLDNNNAQGLYHDLFEIPIDDSNYYSPIWKSYEAKGDRNVPLCVTQEYRGDIPDGTVVGVMLKAKSMSSHPYSVRTEQTGLLASDVTLCTRTQAVSLKKEKMVIVEDKTFRHQAVYEHFFRVHHSSGRDNNSFLTEPVLLDNRFILRKAFRHYFQGIAQVPVEYIEDKEFLIKAYLKTEAGSLESVDLKDSYASYSKVTRFIEYLNNFASSEGLTHHATQKLINRIKRNRPFKHYQNLVDQLSVVSGPEAWLVEVDLPIYRFYQAVEEHRNLLSEKVFTVEEMEAIGSWRRAIENAEAFYTRVLQGLAPLVEIPIEYWIYEPEQLFVPVLDTCTLKSLDKPSIFRVFLPSQDFCLRPSQRFIEWGGSLLPSSLLAYLKPGNIVRIFLGDPGRSEYWSKVYVTYLKPIDSTRFLASHFNVYSTADENVLLVADKRAILEVPLKWTGNENLEQVMPSLTPPREEEEEPESIRDFIGRALSPGYGNTIMDVNTDIPINYDGLF